MKKEYAIIIGSCIVLAAIIMGCFYKYSQNGKYQMLSHGGCVYVLNTKTGDVWSKFKPNGGPTDWAIQKKCPWQQK